MLRLGRIFPLHTRQNYKLVKQLYTTSQNEFKTVYKFPYVRGIGVINRLKWYQTVLAAIAVPSSGVLSHFGYLSLDGVMLTGIASVTVLIPLYGFGYFAHKLIGTVYLNEKDDSVKLSYLNFWGNRKDVVVPLKEIMPFSESPSSVSDVLYLKVRQFSSKETLKLCVKYGIVDYKGFNKIFASYL